ncbi:MAG: Fur family transcriptional regulator [Actinomycetota bacterium]
MTNANGNHDAGAPAAPQPGRTRHVTRQGDAITAILEDIDEFRSAQQIHDELRRRGHRVGLATVYRHLGTLAEDGQVDALRIPSGETVYRQCVAEDHHHHLICRFCGTTVEFEGPEIESWAEAVARRAHFQDVSHTVEIFGTCRDCAARARPHRGAPPRPETPSRS